MAATAAAPRPVFKAGKKPQQLQPPTLKQDKYYRHGGLLQEAEEAPEALERLLAVVRLLMAMLCDIARPSTDTLDTPMVTLGCHYASHRQLGMYADGSVDQVRLQELCTFDPQDGPKDINPGGQVLALLHWSVEPHARAKAKKLGRELYVKVDMNSSGTLQLLRHGEEYDFSLPALVLPEPLQPECALDFKGDLTVRCESSGLVACLTFKGAKAAVKGSLEVRKQAASSTGTAVLSALLGVGAGGVGSAGYMRVGSFAGGWRDAITVSCPGLGVSGVVHTEEGVQPPLASTLDLRQLGPMQLPRLWSAIHDALMFNDRSKAAGGKPAEGLSRSLATSLRALVLDPISTRDVGVSDTVGAPAGAAGDGGAEEDSDEDIPRDSSQEDVRAAPPCCQAEHAAGHCLKYQLQYQLVRRLNTLLHQL